MKDELKKIEQLENFCKEARVEAESFYEKGIKVAGTRLRKKMQEIKAIAQEIRNEVIESKNS